MPIACEDLAQYGVALVAPSAPEYQSLVADIASRLRSRPEGGPPLSDDLLAFSSEDGDEGAAVLLNRASRAIVSVAYIWHLRLANDQVVTASQSPGTNASIFLPFQLNQRTRKFHYYWHTIFPKSKRLIRFEGSMLGDSTDTRPPEPNELWHGGFFHITGGGDRKGKPVKLTLDGVFFEDGGFVGPNQLGSWDQAVFAAETYLQLAALAREDQRSELAAVEFFRDVRSLTGQPDEGRLPPPPPPPSPLSQSRDSEQLRE